MQVPSRPALSADLNDLISQLTVKQAQTRLGYTQITELRKHKWFEGMDWEKLKRHELPALYMPDPKTAITQT